MEDRSMLKKIRTVALHAMAVIALAGCTALPPKFSMHPTPLTVGEIPDQDMAILLVGVTGPAAVDYLQFTHASMPAINVRFSGVADGVVAVAVPVGLSEISLNSITLRGRPGFYLPTGMATGFIAINTPRVDIKKPGIYYVATIDTSNPRQYSLVPIAKQLNVAKQVYEKAFASRETVNFSWPN